jgi:hypothetical protein
MKGSMAAHPVIVLEFNELTPSLIDRFIAEGVLPNFAQLRAESRVFTTLADERPPYLEPWIQWVTVHCGLPYGEHGVFHLNEGHKLAAKRTWEVLGDAGHRTWICGSMNVRDTNGSRGCLLPDPWCTKVKPNPRELEPYFRFIQQNVLEHTNEQMPLGMSAYAEFLSFMIRKGLSASTVRTILSQLVDERRHQTRWKRVVLMDLLQFDVFAHYYRRLSPSFSTFFLNSTAHYQHAYWDSMAPEQFQTATDGEKAKYRDAIKFGYQKMDALIERFMRLAASSNATLVLCTALSQQPSPDFEKRDGGAFYRPKNFADFAKAISLVGSYSVQPVMSEQFHLEFSDPETAQAAAKRLEAIAVNGGPMLAVEHTGTRIFAGCGIHHDLAADTAFVVDGRRIPFFDFFYKMDTGKTGVHHPEGILWIRLPDCRHQTTDERVPLTTVAPTMLSLLRVTPPKQMSAAPLRLD